MKSIREWMAARGIKLEVHSVQDAMSGIRDDRRELGVQAFEGEQDIMDAIRLVAKNNDSSLGGMMTRLAMVVGKYDKELSQRLKSTSRRFLGAEKKMGMDEPLGDVKAPEDNAIAREI
jgi:hypothetical protein